jgi:transposase
MRRSPARKGHRATRSPRALRIAAGEAIDSRPSTLSRRLSFDEAARRKGSNNLATVVSDLDCRCVHEVLDGRSKRVLERYLGSLSEEQRSGVEVVCIDLHDPYRQAVRGKVSRRPDRRRPLSCRARRPGKRSARCAAPASANDRQP